MIRPLIIRRLGWGAILLLLAPMLHTIWVSFSPDSFLTPPTQVWSLRWYRALLHDTRWMNALRQSFLIAGLAALLAVTTAAPSAWSFGKLSARRRRLWGMVYLLPAIVPPAALGFGLLPVVYFTGLWGTTIGMILVHATIGLPIAFLIIRTCSTDQLVELEAAASGLGASPWVIWRRITLPILTPVLFAAGIAVFVLSLNEALVSIFLATPTNETLPTVVWPQLRYSPNPMVAVASCVTAGVGLSGVLIVLRMINSR